MVATTYFGSSPSVKLLLDHGAEVRAGDAVQNDASPLALAAMPGDSDIIALLAAKGADANRRMRLVGQFPTSPLMAAVTFGNPAAMKALLAGGANINERDTDSLTLLHWAVVTHHAESAQVLVRFTCSASGASSAATA
jgi:ankyrin repeat protein